MPDPARPPSVPVPPGPPQYSETALRRCVLAVSVLDDVDIAPHDEGVVLPGSPDVLVTWQECRDALTGAGPDGADPETADGRARLGRALRARRAAADLSPDELAGRLRPVGLPVGHVLHLGQDWPVERVLGGSLDLGLGAVGLDRAAPEALVPLPVHAVEQAGMDAVAAWRTARQLLEELGAVAAQLLARDPQARLRPVRDVDVVTLLGARTLRSALAGEAGGMASVVVPMRRRGWTRLSLVDPAFALAAAAATEAVERGFPRALLVTVDEVQQVPSGGSPEQLALRRPAVSSS